MQLHDHLYAFGLQAGREVFDDPGRLRSALAGTEASAADVELVVQAVQQGAYRAMLSALDAGADPARAIEDSAGRLAAALRADPSSAAWALAVLGFAVGRVGENDVRRYRATGTPPVPPAPSPYGQPTYAPPTYAPPAYAAAPTPPPPPGAWGRPTVATATGPRKSRTGLLLVVGGTVLAIVVAVVLALVVAGGGEDEPSVADDTNSASSGASSDPTSEPTTDPSTDPTDPTDPTSEPTTDPTTEPAATVSSSDALRYSRALINLTRRSGAVSTRIERTIGADDVPGTLEQIRQLRIAIYDFDIAVRGLDLTAVQPSVNEFLTVSGIMISRLDRIYAGAKSTLAIAGRFLALPLDRYDRSYQRLGQEIDENTA